MLPKGYKVSEETKQKISKALLGRHKPPRTEEHKKKLGIARLGKKHSMEAKRKVSNTLKKIGAGKWNKGKVHSKEHLARMSKAMKGRKLTEEHKRKIGKGKKGKKLPSMIGNTNGFKKGQTPWNKGIKYLQISGKKHPNWKGGITPLHQRIRESTKYLQWRSDVFQRDNWTCQTCRLRGYDIHAHHSKSFQKILEENNIISFEQAMNCVELWDVANGVTLCEDCHLLTRGGNYS